MEPMWDMLGLLGGLLIGTLAAAPLSYGDVLATCERGP